MVRFIITCLVVLLVSPAYAQTFVMRVHNRIMNQITYEKYVRQGSWTDTFDDQTGAFLFSVKESLGGRKSEMISPNGVGFIANTDRAPQTLRPGEETFGTMRYLLPGGQLATLSLHVKVYMKGEMTVLEMIGSAPDLVVVNRVGHRGNYRNPEWAESVMMANGQKVVDDRLTRVK